MSERQAAVAKWLALQGKREDLDPETLAQLQTLYAPHKGFGILWSLIMFDRARDQEELTNLNLANEEARARGSVLQGQIRAIDRIYELLLDIADPTVRGFNGIGER